jgi:hypothetical protein
MGIFTKKCSLCGKVEGGKWEDPLMPCKWCGRKFCGSCFQPKIDVVSKNPPLVRVVFRCPTCDYEMTQVVSHEDVQRAKKEGFKWK